MEFQLVELNDRLCQEQSFMESVLSRLDSGDSSALDAIRAHLPDSIQWHRLTIESLNDQIDDPMNHLNRVALLLICEILSRSLRSSEIMLSLIEEMTP